MGKPKKRRSKRKTATVRANERVDLARKVNGKSPVKVYTTVRESGRRLKSLVSGSK